MLLFCSILLEPFCVNVLKLSPVKRRMCTCTSIPSPKILSGGTTVLLGQIFSILEETLRGFFSPLGKNVKLRKNFSKNSVLLALAEKKEEGQVLNCDAKD